MDWSNELILDFLRLYQQEPILWNTTIPEHKNKIDGHEAWRRIKEKLKDGNVPIRELRKKRDNLMSTYRRQHRRVLESLEPGSGEDVFKPEWPFYALMSSFLDDIYKPKKPKKEDLLETDNIKEEYSTEDDDEKTGKFKIPLALQKKATKRAKLNDYEDTRKCNEESYGNFFPEYPQNPELDTCTLYCNLLCSKLKALKENTRDIAMMEIDRLMYNLKQQDNGMASQFQNMMPSIVQPPDYCHQSVLQSNHMTYNRSKHQRVSIPSPGSQSPQHILVNVSPGDYHTSQSSPSHRQGDSPESSPKSANSQEASVSPEP